MGDLLHRNMQPFAVDVLDTFPVLVVQGARQVGKSTFVGQLVETRPARMFTLDDEATFSAAREDPRAFVEQAPDATLVIDEVQRLPRLILAIKAAVDRNRRPGSFVLTGSSNLLRLERSPDSLAGRAVTVELRGFSQDELIGRRGDFAAAVVARPDYPALSTEWRRADYADAIARGGYPEVQKLSQRLRGTWLDSYLSRILERDAAELRRNTQPARLAAVLRLIAANQAGELVKARIADQANIPASSISGYLDVLETLFLSASLPP